MRSAGLDCAVSETGNLCQQGLSLHPFLAPPPSPATPTDRLLGGWGGGNHKVFPLFDELQLEPGCIYYDPRFESIM